MMSSTYSPLYLRIMYKFLPFLFKKCPDGNYHWRWDRICICCECNGWKLIDYKTKTIYYIERYEKLKDGDK